MFYLAWHIKYSPSFSMAYSFFPSFIHSPNKHLLSIQGMPGTVFNLGTWQDVNPAHRCCPERHGIKLASRIPLTVLNGGGRRHCIIHSFSKHLMKDSWAFTWLVFYRLSVRKWQRPFSCSHKLVVQELRGQRPTRYSQRWPQWRMKS